MVDSLNINTPSDAGFTGANVEVWSLEALADRDEATTFEWLKNYTTAIRRADDNAQMLYPDPNEAYTRTYNIKHRLLGYGQSGTGQLKTKEEKRRGNSISFQPQFIRHAVAQNIVGPNQNQLIAQYAKDNQSDLAKWAGYKKQNLDMARMILGCSASMKAYGNGDASSFAGLDSSMVLGDSSFTIINSGLKQNNAKPVQMMPDDGAPKVDYRFYVKMVDETVLDEFGLSDDFQTFAEAFFEGKGYSNPIAKVSYGKRQNIMVIPVEPIDGFGSNLRPSVIIASDQSSIANAGNADLLVGLPNYNSSAGDFDDYTPDGYTKYTEFLSNYLTAAGATSSGIPCKVKAADGTIYDSITVKMGSTNTAYTINLKNDSGGAYVPKAGDKIISKTSAEIAFGSDAYLSSYSSGMWFTNDSEDYGFQKGLAVNFWEGGLPIQNVRKVVNGIMLNFVWNDTVIF